jgi:hypothetical protein
MLVFVLYIVKQVDKSFHLNVNLIKIDHMNFSDLLSYIKKLFENLKSYFMKIWIVILLIKKW